MSSYSIDPGRIAGALAGVAIGDAMGMPSEFMTRDEIRNAYGRIEGFCTPRPGHIHAKMTAGRITDDTEQTLAIIEALDAHGRITPEVAGRAYLKWAEQTNAYESSVLGPSSRKALSLIHISGRLLECGVGNVVVTLGSEGSECYSRGNIAVTLGSEGSECHSSCLLYTSRCV